jgi:penicillin-binding protein 1A
VPLIIGLTHSLNSVAVRLSIDIGAADPIPGHNNVYEEAKRGRAKIVETARKMGIYTPLPDTVSLPIGADDVNVMEMAGAYSVFANGGKRVTPYAAVEIYNSHGDLIYSHDRDAPPLQQVFDRSKIIDMVTMMRNVVQAGTGQAAKLDGIDVCGKTGTTNGFKDAWFNGYSGNFVGTVWFGNDDDTSTNNMTGGSLPARTWHQIMAYAHQGVELKPLPGAPPYPVATTAPLPASDGTNAIPPRHPPVLSHRSVDVLAGIEAATGAISANRNNDP